MPRAIHKPKVSTGAIPAETLEDLFQKLRLPLQPPFPPAEAKSVVEIPSGAGWLYEPKWDGFRCLAFRDNDKIVLQSKAGQPLARYFPELVKALHGLPDGKFVLDGEIVIPAKNGLDFDALLQRIHPAASRIQRLSQETPAMYLVFDLLVAGAKNLTSQPLSARRMALLEFASRFKDSQRVKLSPATTDLATAQRWRREGAARGLDGFPSCPSVLLIPNFLVAVGFPLRPWRPLRLNGFCLWLCWPLLFLVADVHF